MKTIPLLILPENRTIGVAPDAAARKVIAADGLPPRVGVFRWQPAGDGTWRPIYRIHEPVIRAVEFAELVGISYFTLKRLIFSGFVRGGQPSPGLVQVDVQSYFEHQEASRDPDFWTPARRAQYSTVL